MKQVFIALSFLAFAFSATLASAQERVMIDVTAKGFDDAIKRLSSVPGNRQAQQAALVLTLLRGFGKPAGVEAGSQRFDYQIEVVPDGRILINGLDISVLLQAANR